VSLVVALTIIPLLSEQFLRVADVEDEGDAARSGGILGRVGRGVDSLADRYQRALGGALRHAGWIVPVAVVLVVAGVIVQRLAPTGFLPEIDEGAFVLDYVSPGGTALAETDRQLHILEEILASTPEVTGTSRRTGAELGLFATEQNSGDIVVRLKSQGDRSRSSFEIIDDIRGRAEAAVPRLRIEFVQILSDVINDLAGAANPVEIKLFGLDLNALESYAKQLEPTLEKVDGLEDFYNGVAEPSAELDMSVNMAEANRVGLTPAQVAEATAGHSSACRPVRSASTTARLPFAFVLLIQYGSTRVCSERYRSFRHRRAVPCRSVRSRPSSRSIRGQYCSGKTNSR
jgi:multidrug efflux pump subunit AcrB